jgi:heme/copper-type cytochrome/quinol oxidase subunit 4
MRNRSYVSYVFSAILTVLPIAVICAACGVG